MNIIPIYLHIANNWLSVYQQWKHKNLQPGTFKSAVKRLATIVSPHCCRARASCPPPWCGASATGRGGCLWWCPCGWSSQCKPASSSEVRWVMARYLLKDESILLPAWTQLIQFSFDLLGRLSCDLSLRLKFPIDNQTIHCTHKLTNANNWLIPTTANCWLRISCKKAAREGLCGQSVQTWLVK